MLYSVSALPTSNSDDTPARSTRKQIGLESIGDLYEAADVFWGGTAGIHLSTRPASSLTKIPEDMISGSSFRTGRWI